MWHEARLEQVKLGVYECALLQCGNFVVECRRSQLRPCSGHVEEEEEDKEMREEEREVQEVEVAGDAASPSTPISKRRRQRQRSFRTINPPKRRRAVRPRAEAVNVSREEDAAAEEEEGAR